MALNPRRIRPSGASRAEGMSTVTKHAARTGRYCGTHEPKPARVAREPGGRFRNGRLSRWVYALLGGVGAVGVGQIARTAADTADTNAPPTPTSRLEATMPSSTMQSSTRPGEMTPAELKRNMAEALAAIDQDPILRKRYMAAMEDRQSLLSAATAEVWQSLSTTEDVAAIDSARANITKEVQALPSLADLSVEAVGLSRRACWLTFSRKSDVVSSTRPWTKYCPSLIATTGGSRQARPVRRPAKCIRPLPTPRYKSLWTRSSRTPSVGRSSSRRFR